MPVVVCALLVESQDQQKTGFVIGLLAAERMSNGVSSLALVSTVQPPHQLPCVCHVSLLLSNRRMRCINSSLARAAQLQSYIRVVKQQPTPVVASLLDSEFSPQVCKHGVLFLPADN